MRDASATSSRRSFIIFLMPIVVIGGIVGGAFTATEGSAIAVVYALVIGFFVTRRLRLADLPEAWCRTAHHPAVVGAMIAFASVVTYMLTVDHAAGAAVAPAARD